MRIGVNRYILRSERDDEISREEHQNIYLQTFSICLRAKRKHKHMRREINDLKKNLVEYLEMKNKISKIKIPLNKISTI